jgi:hypothetical protein
MEKLNTTFLYKGQPITYNDTLARQNAVQGYVPSLSHQVNGSAE